MNIFRIPLNAFVVLLLLKIKYLSSQIVFAICTIAHGTAFLCYLYFYSSNQHRNHERLSQTDLDSIGEISKNAEV
jgi:hypothetical protein